MRPQRTKKLKTLIITSFYLATVALNLVAPLHSFAQEVQQPTETQEIAPPDPKYIYNEQTGKWENGTYAWDPATNTTTPFTKQNYSYNPETGKWDTTEWVYDDTAQNYTESPTISPSTTAISSEPSPLESQTSNDTNSTDLPSYSPIVGTNSLPTSTSTAGPDSQQIADSQAKDSTFFNGYFDATISVTVASSARSGDALVVNNTVAGNASTGQALASASALNMLQSTWNTGTNGKSPQLYNVTIQGGHSGDLIIDPKFASSTAQNNQQELVVNQSNNVSIENQLAITAQSGNANVSNNTIAGDASTGDAFALANLMNMVNSSVAAQESFIAVLNVLGDFEGDILLPPELQRQLSSTRGGALQIPVGQSSTLTTNDTTDIQTAVNAQATSGSAIVSHNTIAGDATSGEATTSVMVYNLTGKQIVAENAVLVFVNVLGEWVGFITDAPAGSRVAMLGCCDETTQSNTTQDTAITIDNQTSITNDITLSAQSGNATVSSNMQGGDASTGDAFALANVMNLSNSSVSMSGWFAVMFINIMGNWHGSFGTDTQYGGFSQTTGGNGGGSSNSGSDSSPTTAQIPNGQTTPLAKTTTTSAPLLARQQNRTKTNVGIDTTASNPEPQTTTEVLAESTTPLPSNIAQQLTKKSFPGVVLLIATATTLGAVLVFRSKGV